MKHILWTKVKLLTISILSMMVFPMAVIEGSQRRAGRYGAAGALTATKTASVYLTTADPTIILVTTDGIYLYLPTYVGNSGLNFIIKQNATFSAGTVIYTLAAQSTALDGAAKKTCGANYDTLEVMCDGTNWNIVGKIGTWS